MRETDAGIVLFFFLSVSIYSLCKLSCLKCRVVGAGKTFQLYSHNLIGLFEQLRKPGLAAQFQTHRFPDRILPR